MNKPSAIYKNTAFVTALAVAERALGFLYRVVLARLLGAEGVGVYQIALSHFFLFRTVGGGGLPVTLSRCVSKCNAENSPQKSGGALIAACLISLALTLPITLILSPFLGKIPLFSSDASVLQILLVSLSFTCVYAVIKGYFWGNKQFLAPALLECVEEILTVILGVLFLMFAGECTPVEGAKSAAFAMSAACILSFIACIALLLAQKPKRSSPKPFFKPVFFSALPITAVRTGSTFVNAAVAVLIPAMLTKAGMAESEALQAFGVATGMVFPLLSIPMTVIGSLSTVLVPELAEDHQKGNALRLRRTVERGLYFCTLVATVLMPFFAVLGNDLGLLTYQNALAGEMLQNSSALLLPMSVCALSGSVLNSLGFEKQSFLFSLIGSAVFLLCITLLPAVMGVYAFTFGMFVELSLCAAMQLIFLQRRCPLSKTFYQKCLLLIALALPISLLGQLYASLFGGFLGEWLAPIAVAAAMAITTFAVYFLFRLLPMGKKAKKA